MGEQAWNLNYALPKNGGLNSITQGSFAQQQDMGFNPNTLNNYGAGSLGTSNQIGLNGFDMNTFLPELGNIGNPGGGGFDWGGAWNKLDFGKIGSGLQGISGLMGAWNGMKQLDLAEDQFAFQKNAYNKNYDNQVKTVNTELADRQKRRLSADPNSWESVKSYMAQNGL